jgi:hypothetical protein
MVLAWANLHGSFFLGPAILLYAWLEDRWLRAPRPDRTLVIAIVAAGASLLNPWGPGVWQYAFGLSVSPTIRTLLAEWQVTTPLPPSGRFPLGVGAAAIVIRRPRPVLCRNSGSRRCGYGRPPSEVSSAGDRAVGPGRGPTAG